MDGLEDFGQGVGEMNESVTEILQGLTNAFQGVYSTIKPGPVAPGTVTPTQPRPSNTTSWLIGTIVVLGVGYMLYTAMSRKARRS